MTQNEWSERLTRQVASEVRRHRSARGLSTQKLSDACAALGHPIPRSVLANLEFGRRPMITLAELLVLARALDLPPVMLMLPIGGASSVEVLPGVDVSPPRALRWLDGQADLDGDDVPADIRTTLADTAVHEHYVLALIDCMENVEESRDELVPYSEAGEYHRDLMFARKRMEARGEVLPDLPPRLAWVDAVRPATKTGHLDDPESLPRGLRPGHRLPWEAP